ncbi:MAG: adenosylmethionine--8-amino-7-oxononanoate transaminase [Thermonemataceae bacterium]
MNCLERDKKAIWHPFTPLVEGHEEHFVTRAKGVYLYTSDGREIIDAISSWWVNLHGHAHPDIAEAIAQQAQQLEHVIFAGFTHQPAIELAERLLQILPPNQHKVFYSDNGSTACEVALKMAIQYWHNLGTPKTKVIAIDGGYHGDTFGAMSVGDRSPFSAPFNPLLFEVDFIDFPACAQIACCAGQGNAGVHCGQAQQTIQQFEQLVATGEVAAFIYEPLVQGASGMRMYSKEILDRLLAIAQQYDVICIADEVMTGFGRTGKLFASEYCEHLPDIMCLSKGLTGGTMALGATTCTEKIMEAYREADLMKTFFHGHSFTANPLACSAALASLALLLHPQCIADIARIEQSHITFEQEIRAYKAVKEVRTLGTIIAIELATDQETGYFNEARSSLYTYFLEREVLLRPLGNVLYIIPPYVTNEAALQKIYQVIQTFLETFEVN